MRAAPLLELVLEQREDLLAGRASVGRAVRVLHADEAALRRLPRRRSGTARACPSSSVFQNMSLSRSPRCPSWRRSRRDRRSGRSTRPRAVAVDDGEADAVERQPHAAPRAVERVVDDELVRAVGVLVDARAWSGAIVACAHGRARRGLGRAELHHQPRQHLGLERRVGRHHRPHERRRRRVVDLASSAPAPCRDARCRSRPCRARRRARSACGTCRACSVVQKMSTTLPTVRLRGSPAACSARFSAQSVSMMPSVRLLDREHEADVLPELAHRVPRLLRRGLDDQPALVAGADDLGVRRRVGSNSPRRALVGALRGEARRRVDLVAVVVARRGEVGRQFERGRAATPTCSRSAW